MVIVDTKVNTFVFIKLPVTGDRDRAVWVGELPLELVTGRRNCRDTTGEGCKLFCNSCCNKLSVTVTVCLHMQNWDSE
jgi:hypothetical protein